MDQANEDTIDVEEAPKLRAVPPPPAEEPLPVELSEVDSLRLKLSDAQHTIAKVRLENAALHELIARNQAIEIGKELHERYRISERDGKLADDVRTIVRKG